MANYIRVLRAMEDLNTRQIYSMVGFGEVCILQYKKDSFFNVNVGFTNDCKQRSEHYIDGINSLFDYNSPKYNYAVALYKQFKRLDKRLIDNGTLALGRDAYEQAVIKYLSKNNIEATRGRELVGDIFARDYGIIKLVG